MRGALVNENCVAPPKRLPVSWTVHPRLDGPVFLKFCCALGCVESCRSNSPDDTRFAVRGDVGEVSAVVTGPDFAVSETVLECCQDIETEAHGVK